MLTEKDLDDAFLAMSWWLSGRANETSTSEWDGAASYDVMHAGIGEVE